MTRLIMPFTEWPEIDQDRWRQARKKGDILTSSGLAADWSDLTVKQDLKAYGLWLQYLENNGLLDASASPGSRLTQANVNRYARDLGKRVASTTLASRLSTLSRMIRVLDCDADRRWLIEIQERFARRAKPSRKKQEKILHPSEILCAFLRSTQLHTVIGPSHQL